MNSLAMMPFASGAKTYVAIAIVIFVCVTVLLPIQKAHAVTLIVEDVVNYAINILKLAAEYVVKSLTDKMVLKEYVLDTLAYIAAHTILRAMTNQILGWIQGTDADFIQNLEDEFIRTADAEAGGLLNEITGLNLCGNIGAFLTLSLGAPKTSFRQRITCTATQAVSNIEGFYRNFTQGGWNAFFKIALEPQNNAYGAFMLTLNEQAQRTDNKQASLQQRLLEGDGFLGFSVSRKANCQRVSGEDAATLQENLRVQQQVWGKENKPEQSIETDNADPENPTFSFCDVAYDTKTPGSLFSEALPEAVFSDKRRAEMADEINESIAQIVLVLLNKVITASTGSGRGVLGSREIAQLPPVTPADYGFTPTYMTDRADDASLRLQGVQKDLDAKIQSLDAQITIINEQINVLQAVCDDIDPLTVCDQTQIEKLKNQKSPLITERAEQIGSLKNTDAVLSQILGLRTKIVATTNSALLQNLNTKLTAAVTGAEALITQLKGPPEGQTSVDPNKNVVSVIDNDTSHANSVIVWLDKKMQAEIPPIIILLKSETKILKTLQALHDYPGVDGAKKNLLKAAVQALIDSGETAPIIISLQKKITAELALMVLRDDLETLRADFLAAVSSKSEVIQVLGRVTDKINEINTTATGDYDQFRAL